MISIDGLISGLDTTNIIKQLIDVERRPINALQTRVAGETAKQTAFLDLSARFLSLKSSSSVLAGATSYQSTAVTSSNEAILSATGTNVGTTGSFTFTVSKLAQTSQLVSQGFVDSDTSAIGAGLFSIETGAAGLNRPTALEQLNGGAGVDRGSIKITDRNGNVAVIDLSAATSVQDVVDTINANNAINVSAFSNGRSLVMAQTDGASATNLQVQNVGSDTTATDLGLIANVASGSFIGTDIYTLGRATALNTLNDDLGVATGSSDGVTITARDGVAFTINTSGKSTVGNILDLINNDTTNAGRVTASLSGGRFVLTDSSGGGGTLQVTAPVASPSSTTLADLGLTTTATGNLLTGGQVIADMNNFLLKTVNGGSGISNVAGLSDFRVTLADGVTTFDVNLDGIETGKELGNQITAQAAAAGGTVSATFNRSGLGAAIVDHVGGASNITITALNGSTAAAELGFLGTGNGAKLEGRNINLQYVSRNTRLESLNSGKGVFAGSIKITDRTGAFHTIDLSQTSNIDIASVIQDINGGTGGSVTASINSTGDGLLLTDTTAGTGPFKVEEVAGGTTARDLNLLGTINGSSEINGSFEHSVTISATDTLNDIARAINDLGIDVQASVINTGTGSTPFRLSIISKNSGKDGEIFLDPGTSAFQFTTTSAASDSVLLFGTNSTTDDPILISSSDNSVKNLVPGLSLELNSAAVSSPVTVTVSRDTTLISDNVARFVDSFNDIVSRIDELTAFNAETEQRGILLGNSTLRSMRRQMFSGITRPVTGVPSNMSLLSQVGVRVEQNGRLSFDPTTFDTALETNFEGVVDLFTKFKEVASNTKLTNLKNGLGVEINRSGDDLKIHLRNGTDFDVSLTGALDVQDVIDAINSDADNDIGSGIRVTASISTDKRSLLLTEDPVLGGSGTLRVTGLNSSRAFAGLGFSNPITNSGGVLTGSPLNVAGAPGAGKRLDEILERITDAVNGSIKTATNGFDARIESLNQSIEDLEERLTSKEQRLRDQFTRMEIAMSESQNTLSRLQSQLGSLAQQ